MHQHHVPAVVVLHRGRRCCRAFALANAHPQRAIDGLERAQKTLDRLPHQNTIALGDDAVQRKVQRRVEEDQLEIGE